MKRLSPAATNATGGADAEIRYLIVSLANWQSLRVTYAQEGEEVNLEIAVDEQGLFC